MHVNHSITPDSEPWSCTFSEEEIQLIMNGLLSTHYHSKRFVKVLNNLYQNLNALGLFDKFRNGSSHCPFK